MQISAQSSRVLLNDKNMTWENLVGATGIEPATAGV
jgi:hypothetical protein